MRVFNPDSIPAEDPSSESMGGGDDEGDSDDACEEEEAHEEEEEEFEDEMKEAYLDPNFMEDYMAAMDRELGGSTMMETFERRLVDQVEAGAKTSDDDEHDPIVDIDLNLLKNLLESHALQIGKSP